jgi:hypothetical protein
MSLLWLSKTCKLKDGSEAFGRLLRRVCDFSSWIAKVEKGKNALKYEYFSSNCCRVDDDVSSQFDRLFLCFLVFGAYGLTYLLYCDRSLFFEVTIAVSVQLHDRLPFI